MKSISQVSLFQERSPGQGRPDIPESNLSEKIGMYILIVIVLVCIADCDVIRCEGIPHNQSDVCSGNGICDNSTDPGVCNCYQDSQDGYYFGINCNISECYDYLSNDTINACSSHGLCLGYNNCSCNGNYSGAACQYWTCFGVASHIAEVCDGHGICVDIDNCFCFNGYDSYFTDGPCEKWYCGNVFYNQTGVCSGRGQCVSADTCKCVDGYSGDLCDISISGQVVVFFVMVFLCVFALF